HVLAVEIVEPLLGERRRGAQLAGGKSGARPAEAFEMALHESKPVGERERLGEPYTLDLEARLRGHAARVLEHRRDIPVTALLEHDAGAHCRSLRRYLVTAVRSAACAISAPCC